MEHIKRMMNFNRKEFYMNPHDCFDCPPPNFEIPSDNGWTMLANAIINKESGLKRYVDYAKKWKEKEHEWDSVSIIYSAFIQFTLEKNIHNIYFCMLLK